MKIVSGKMSFEEGDVVRLKSGGPDMTVTDAGDRGDIQVSWFAGKYEKCSSFTEEALELTTTITC